MSEQIQCAWCEWQVYWGTQRTPEEGETSYSFKCPNCGQMRVGHLPPDRRSWWKRQKDWFRNTFIDDRV